MAVYAIADLHLSNGTPDKSMTVFGSGWTDYQNRLTKAWTQLVRDGDTVIIPGDISWGLTLEESLADFEFLDRLPGTKYIGKGNHDFFWSTVRKMERFFADHQLTTIKILYNNAYYFPEIEAVACGTRGWFQDERFQSESVHADYEKVYNRELIRLRMSLDEAKKLQAIHHVPITAFLHFPPVWNNEECPEIIELLKTYGVSECYFGHIHGQYNVPAAFDYKGIRMHFIAADYLNFTPCRVLAGKNS